MSTTTGNPPLSPGVGARRPGGKVPPKLPLSLFAKAAEAAPLTADPTTVFPDAIIDASVAVDLEEWKSQAGDLLKKPISGVVVSLRGAAGQVSLDEERLNEILSSNSGVPVTAVIAPTHFADRSISKLPPHITNSPSPIAFSVSFTSGATTPEDIKLILSAGHVVDVDVPWTSSQAEAEAEWDSLEDVLSKAVDGLPTDRPQKAIVISNLLPPPHSLTIPIVRLLAHPSYALYQSRISSLSLIPSTYLKFLPPSWDDPTPPSPAPGFERPQGTSQDVHAKEEWKRRVRMFLGPALDAFGVERLIFGSSPSASSTSASTPHDWYNLVREVVAELGVEQQGINAVFGDNAKAVYGN